ncbi:MAG: hypothetical protein JSW04_12645 [Desulfobacterales bacterium]|nr:MAG: hypothetical protein JSW04_12645 [Desulfobacterales bacterium]
MAQLAVIGAAVCYFSFVTADPDLWGHIKFGEDLWESRSFIRTDPYSFTAYGHPWINHEWLAELVFYFVYAYLGDAGLLFGKLGIGLVVVLLIQRLCAYRKLDAIIYALIMIPAVMIISPGFMIRPQVFSFLLFALYLYLLHRYFVQSKNRLFFLPCLMLFWVNLHGGFLMGLALLFTVVAWKSLSRLVFDDKDSRLGSLWFWFALTSIATLFNPNGYKLLIFLFKTLSLPRQIGEWNPIRLFDLSHLYFKLLALLFFFAILIQARAKAGWEASAIAMTMIASVIHQRHSPFFAIIIAPHLVHRLSILIEDTQSRFPRLVLTGESKTIIAIVLGVLAGYQMHCGFSKYLLANCRIIVNPNSYPIAVVDYLKKNKVTGHLLLPMEWGEYAIWKLHPDCRVSIDGRFRTVYPESIIQDHFVPEQDIEGWTALIQKYPADILLMRQTKFFQQLIKTDGPWIYIYSDPTAIVFLRNNTKNNEVLQRFKSGRFVRPESPSIYFP